MRCWLLVVLCACGDNAVGTPLSEFDADSDRARCERSVRCGLFADASACDGFFRKRPDVNLAGAIASHYVSYSGPAAEQCIAELAVQSCDTSSRDARTRPEVCNQVFVGTIKAGDSCALDEECATGTCTVPACGQACCEGVCRASRKPAAIGDACELDVDCAADSFCGRDVVCHGLGGEGAECDNDNECDYGSACISPTAQMPGNCRKQPALGEPCLYLRCAEVGAVCTAGSCVGVGLPGAACTMSSDCSPFAICDQAAQKCVAVPRLGDPCVFGCAGEAWCDLDGTKTCVAPQPNAAPCGAADQCASLYCEGGVIFDDCANAPVCF